MSKKLSHIRNITLSLAFLAAAGCAHDDLQPAVEDDSSDQYMLLRLALPAGSDLTRANPMGGEEGNGREDGIINENKIHDINVFFYDAPEGLDADAETEILFHIYYNCDNPEDTDNNVPEDFSASPKSNGNNLFSSSNYMELSFSLPKDENMKLGEGVKFAAVANVGCLKDITTLGSLRDVNLTERIKSGSVSTTKADAMDYFPMSTAYNQEYIADGKTTGKNEVVAGIGKDHYEGTTTMERLYARIDLWYNFSENARMVTPVAGGEDYLGYLEYKVIEEAAGTTPDTGNRVFLYNMLPVNVMQTPSYLFKKVTETPVGDTPTWNSTYLSSIKTFNWGGKETPNTIPTSAPTDLPTNYVMEPTTLRKSADNSDGDFTQWYGATAAGRVREEITDNEKGRFREYYHQARNKGDYDPDYNCDHISIISYANENTQPVDCFHSNYMTGLAIRGFYVPAHIYSEYTPADGAVSTTETLRELTEEEKKSGDITVSKIWRYSPSGGDKNPSEKNSIYFTGEEAAKRYKDAHQDENGILTDFPAEYNGIYGIGFTCYYNLWLRHYNDEKADPQQSYPLEYATVRNNIYRVALTFTGPGDPTPTMREPDTMKARIFVRKWNLREEQTPLEF